MNYIKVDAKFFFHVFIGFIFTTLIVTGFLVYQVNRVSEDHGIFGKKVKYSSLDGKLWSHDPDVMEALMRARARRSLVAGHRHVNLTQITFNDSCFGFVWSKFNILNIVKYQVEVMSIKEPKLPPLMEVIGGTSSEYNICGLNVATPYMVNLTAFGQNTDSKETSVEVMWTTHQVPPTPGDLVLMSVSETTMKLYLPEITLKHGPLSAVEIRLNPKRSVPDPEEDSSPWSRVISRSKRSSVEPCQNQLFLPTVEFPYQMLVKFYNHMTKVGQNVNVGLSKSNRVKVTSMEKQFRQMEKKDQISRNAELNLTQASDFKKADGAAESKSNESKTEADEKGEIIFSKEGDEKSNRERSNANLGNGSLEWWLLTARQSMKETFSNRNDSPTLGLFVDKQSTGESMTSFSREQGEKKEMYNYVMKVLGEWLEPDTSSIAIAQQSYVNLSKLPPVSLDVGLEPHFDTIYMLSRPEIVHKLLTPASELEDMWILINLVNDINTILNMEESSNDKVKESQTESSQVDNFYLTASDKLKPNSNIPTPAIEKVRSSVTNYSTGNDLNAAMAPVTLEPVDVITSRGARKTARVKRSLKWKWPAASWQKEVDDGLDIDPYQTLQVVSKNSSQPTVVKTGFGFFIIDHYGVRHPYFNNTKLGQNLLRYNRYQEIKDFVYYGQSLLSNLTNMTVDILEELRLRIDKIMETNRKRKTKLYLDMFEDFLSLDRAKRQSQTNIPDPGRLGLPPGYQVAHFTDGMPKNVTLGNHVEYGGIPNPPLEPSTEYEVVLSVLSSVADVTKHSWISINVTTAARVHKIFSPIFVILSGAFMATCLFICLLGCFVLWCSKGKRKLPFDDDQFDDLRLQLPNDFLTKSPSNMQGDAGLIYRGTQPSTYPSNMYQIQPPPHPPPQYPIFPYPMYQPSPPPFLMPPFMPQSNELPTKSENKVNIVEKQDMSKPEEEESSDNEGDINIETTDNSLDEDMTLPNYLRKSHKPESHWNRIYDVSSKRFLVHKRENLMDHDGRSPAIQNYLSDEDDDMKGLTFKDEYFSLTEGPHNFSTNALILGTDFNRFPHIQLCEHSRVVVKPDTGSGNTVIHANFINGYHIGYIAAMSPFNDATVLDFWKMIYQQNIEIIVMMTKVVERDIIKCAEYWPPCSETVSTLGHFLLQTVKEMIYSDFTVRTIKLKMNNDKTCREITQFQYTAWPTQGFPMTPVPLLDMRYKIRSYHQGKRSPILVHCGTGISRTSIFIAADILIDEYEEKGGVSVYTCVNNMRRDRSMMVRTLDQYVFIYKVIQEDFEAGDTNCDLDEGLQITIFNLGQINPKTRRSYIEDQFEILNFFTLDFLSDDLSIARQLDYRNHKVKRNRAKNFVAEKIITDEFLALHPVFLDGYRIKNQFVLMNSPTTDDDINMFWKFICKHNIITIVQLGQDEKPGSVEGVRDKKRKVKHKSQHSKPRYIHLKHSEGQHSKYFTETTSINRFGDIFMRDLQLEEQKSSGNKLRHIRHYSTPFHHLVCDFSRNRNRNLKKGKITNSRNKDDNGNGEKNNNLTISSSSELDISSNKKFVDSELEINKTRYLPGQQQEVINAEHFKRQQQAIYKTQQVPWQEQKAKRNSFLHEWQFQEGKDFDPRNVEIERKFNNFNNLYERHDYKQQEKKSNKPCVCMYNGRPYQMDNSHVIGTKRHLTPFVHNKTKYQVVERHELHTSEYPMETSKFDAPSVSTDSTKSENKFYYVLKDGSLVKSKNYNESQQRSKLSNGNGSCFPIRHKTHMTNAQRKYYTKHYNIMQNGHSRKESDKTCRDSSKHADRGVKFQNSFVPPKSNNLAHESKEQSLHFLPSKRKMIEKLRNVQHTIICSSRIARKHIKTQPPRFLRAKKNLSNYRSALFRKLSTSRLDQSNSALSPELISQSCFDPSLKPSLAQLNKTRWLPLQLHNHKYSHLRGIVNTQESLGSKNLVKLQEFSKDLKSVRDSAQLKRFPISGRWQDYSLHHKAFYSESYTSSGSSSMIKSYQKFHRISQSKCPDSESLSMNAKSPNCDEKERVLKGDELTLKMLNNKKLFNSRCSQRSLRSHIEYDPHRTRFSKKRTLKQCKTTQHRDAVNHEMEEDGNESTQKLTATSEKTVEQVGQGHENRNQSSVSPKRKGFKKSKKSMFASPDRCKTALTPGQLLDLLELIWEWQSTPFQVYGKNKALPPPTHRPILIHCAEGTDDANLMCACALVCERVQEEQQVDIYHILKHFRKKCPKAIASFAEYEFIYRVLCHYVSEYMDDVALSNRWMFRGHINTTYHSVIDEAVLGLAHEFETAYSDNTGNKADSHQSDLDRVTVDELSLLNDSDVSVKMLTLAKKTISKPISPESIQHTVRSFIHKSLVNDISSAIHRDSRNSEGSVSSSPGGRNENQSRDKFVGKSYDEKLSEKMTCHISMPDINKETFGAPLNHRLKSPDLNQDFVICESGVEIEYSKVIHIHSPTSLCGFDRPSEVQHARKSANVDLVLTDIIDSNDHDIMCSAGKSSTNIIQGMERFSYELMDSNI